MDSGNAAGVLALLLANGAIVAPGTGERDWLRGHPIERSRLEAVISALGQELYDEGRLDWGSGSAADLLACCASGAENAWVNPAALSAMVEATSAGTLAADAAAYGMSIELDDGAEIPVSLGVDQGDELMAWLLGE